MKKDKDKIKKKDEGNPSFFSELGCFMEPYKSKYILSILISVAGVAASVASYGFAGLVAGKIFENGVTWKIIVPLIAAAVLLKIMFAVCINVSTWISHKAAYMTLRDIRNAVAEKLMRIPMGYFEENGSGRLKTLIADRIETMEKTLAHLLPELTANLLVPAVCMIWMFFIDWRLALCVILWITAGFSVTAGMMKNYDEKFQGQIAALKGMNQAVTEYVNGIEVIKNFGRADECYKKYQDAVYGHAEYNVNWQKETQKFSALGMAIAPFSIFPVLVAGLIFYSRGTLEPSTLFMVIILTFGIFGPLMSTMNYFDQLAGMGTDAKEIKDVLDFPDLERRGTATADEGSVEFRNVSFSYDQNGPEALSNISFKVPEGSIFALAGPSGSGKSTIAKLIAGFWDTDSGDIIIGGHSIRDYSQEELNKTVSYVDQDTFLFDESILDNIRKGRPGASEEEVREAAKRAGCDEFIEALPDGYYTSAGAAGGRLSGGEKQRIAIVRAMMKDSPVMILDEATSSSDPENEASIQKALAEAAKDKTLIVVAHRLRTIVNADQIAFVKNGKIEAAGTHSQLLEKSGEYRKMWELSEEDQDD